MTLTKVGRSKIARARKTGESVSYRVWIIGIAWQGFEGCADYTFDHEPTLEDIERKAIDKCCTAYGC